MSIRTELDRLGIEGYLEKYRRQDLLRFLTCGSVDDGKSTLIGRLLHDSAMVYEDQLAAAKRDSKRYGTTGEEIDLALLVDGLEAEREQGITIDVAYRYFTTDRRKFIIADTPGHEQYTRNMATGASNCDLAVILIDARKGVLDQTRRHSFIVSLLGIRHVVVAVNKMDLVGYREEVFDAIRADYGDFAAKLQVSDVHFIPLSALRGDNVVFRSESMPWYRGGPLLDYLETVHIASDRNLIDFRMAVQNVVRPNADFRGFAGTIAAGTVRPGDPLVALPSGRRSRVKSIVTFSGEIPEAFAGMAVTLTLEDEIDVSRGDVFAHVQNVPRLQTHHEAMVVWMNDAKLEPGRSYLLKQMTTTTPARVAAVRYRINVNSLRREEAAELRLNEVGRVELETMRPLAVDAYQRSRPLGAFILIDRLTNATMGAGMIVDRTPADVEFARRKASADAGTNLAPARTSLVPLAERSGRLGHPPFTVWLTGLPRSGKTTIAFALERALFDRGVAAHVLDSGSLRRGISSDLGFSADDRAEHLRRTAAVARLTNDLGLVTIVALVSPLASDREAARRAVGEDRFLEVHCDAPLDVCAARDPVGLYERARRGEARDVTGVDAPYDRPANPAIRLDTAARTVDENVAAILADLRRRGFVR